MKALRVCQHRAGSFCHVTQVLGSIKTCLQITSNLQGIFSKQAERYLLNISLLNAPFIHAHRDESLEHLCPFLRDAITPRDVTSKCHVYLLSGTSTGFLSHLDLFLKFFLFFRESLRLIFGISTSVLFLPNDRT